MWETMTQKAAKSRRKSKQLECRVPFVGATAASTVATTGSVCSVGGATACVEVSCGGDIAFLGGPGEDGLCPGCSGRGPGKEKRGRRGSRTGRPIQTNPG